MPTAVRVLLAEDQELIRVSIRHLLEQEPQLLVVGEASNGEEAVTMAAELAPDVILLDLVMPPLSGIETIKAIKAVNATVRILVFSGYTEDALIFEAFKAGIAGFVPKTVAFDELLKAIESVHRGDMPLHDSIAGKVIRKLINPMPEPPVPLERLTQREVEILRLLGHGHSNQEIARLLWVSELTVRTHVASILKKLHLESRTRAALYAVKQGLVDLDECMNGLGHPTPPQHSQ